MSASDHLPSPSVLAPLLQPLPLPFGKQLPCRMFPGPMDGITAGSFIKAMTLHGYAPLWHTPFLRISTGIPRRARLQAWLAPFLETKLPVIAQLMGVDEGKLAAAAEKLAAFPLQCIDLNCACPSPIVVRNGAGGARLQQPSWVANTLKTMRKSLLRMPLSIKIRCGFQSPDEIPQLCDAVLEGRPDMVFCHFRTVQELYRPVPMEQALRRLREVRRRLDGIPLFGSGDLFTLKDIRHMVEETGVDGVCPARGLLTRPNLLLQTRRLAMGEPVDDRRAEREFLEFVADLARFSNPRASNSFLLRLAAGFYGRQNPFFLSLIDCRTVGNTLLRIQEALDVPQNLH